MVAVLTIDAAVRLALALQSGTSVRRSTAQDCVTVAVRAGLRYVNDGQPGLSRFKHGRGFVFKDAAGRRVTNPVTLKRVRALAIPPAWTDVWISATPRGHIQAIGRDARGRKQYRYHAAWTAARDSGKFHRTVAFGQALPQIRRRTEQHLRRRPLCRERVMATLVRIMEKTSIRIGNDEYARLNGSYGLTTMRSRHARVHGRHVNFDFRAKSGVLQHVDLEDARLARLVKQCQELPGQTLFQYVDEHGVRREVSSGDVNAYLRDVSGGDFTAKDFRTWTATVLAAVELAHADAQPETPTSVTARTRRLNAAIGVVAAQLGNTRTVCRQCYIHPAVVQGYLAGDTVTLAKRPRPVRGLTAAESAVIRFLQRADATSSRAA
jgi:DNA topoisomerase-1